MRSGASKCAFASITFSADCSASELGAPCVASKKRRASQRRKPLERIGQVSRWPLMSRSAKPVPSGAWNNSADCASSIRMSACVGPRPPVSPLPRRWPRRAPSPGSPHPSTVPAAPRMRRGRLSSARQAAPKRPVQRARRDRSRSSRPALQWIADFLGRINGGGDEVFGFVGVVAVHCAPSSMRGARSISMIVEIHSLRRTGDAHAATFPLPSPCAVTRCRLAGFVAIGEHDHIAHIFRQTETPQSGRRSAAHAGFPVACMAAKQVSMPSRPSAHRRVQRAAPHRHGKARASSSADQLALYRPLTGEQGAVDRQRRTVRARLSPAPPSPARCRPKDVSARHGSGARRRRQIDAARYEIGFTSVPSSNVLYLPDRESRLGCARRRRDLARARKHMPPWAR